MLNCVRFCLVAIALLGFGAVEGASAGTATVQNIKPHMAWAKVKSGKVTLIDVRSRAEWLQSGVPKKAHLVTIHDPRGIDAFVRGVSKTVRGNLKKPVALICRSGNRSAKAAAILVKAGFRNVFNVQYGVLGTGAKTKGWVASGLPMKRCGDCWAEN